MSVRPPLGVSTFRMLERIDARYSTDLPGQALAYQMGKRKLLELRARTEDALGDGFDLRGFHDVVLRTGSVPMVVLEGQVDAWIGGRGAAGGGS